MMIKQFLLPALAIMILAGGACSSNEAGNGEGESATADSTAKATAEKQQTYPIRDKNNAIVTLETNFGNMTLELYRDIAPAHADSFLARTKDGFYDSTIFHRVVKNFMIQGGNAMAVGKPQAGYSLEAEFNDLPHQEGTLSMARAQSPNSASTQFFICLARNPQTQWLDGKYTNFGQLIRGYEVLQAIGEAPVRASRMMGGEVSEPVEKVHLYDAYVSDAEGNPLEQ